uniref:ATP synthase F0 subunit 8 n=1 Tax=Pheidole taipoana TaxID=615548 RepID=UPI00257C41DC|nr:ATP synthase F0 subunit 8 [Pheidole taipoana]WGV34108.1 ATP synthase F0 subunit 8 [Pheidole taipoana]
MPQMMPMLWMMMLMFTISILLIIIIFTHFLNMPMIFLNHPPNKITKFTYWNWLW